MYQIKYHVNSTAFTCTCSGSS